MQILKICVKGAPNWNHLAAENSNHDHQALDSFGTVLLSVLKKWGYIYEGMISWDKAAFASNPVIVHFGVCISQKLGQLIDID